MGQLIWVVIAGFVAALGWFVWVDGQAAPGEYLFSLPDAQTEAGYCLAVAERVREITHGQGEPKLETFVGENIDFWRGRVRGAETRGRTALGVDLAKPGVNEGAHLHLAIQDCGNRAVALYGHRFESMTEG